MSNGLATALQICKRNNLRKAIYGKLRQDIGEILRKLCQQKGVEIMEAEACLKHIHMPVSIPPQTKFPSKSIWTRSRVASKSKQK